MQREKKGERENKIEIDSQNKSGKILAYTHARKTKKAA